MVVLVVVVVVASVFAVDVYVIAGTVPSVLRVFRSDPLEGSTSFKVVLPQWVIIVPLDPISTPILEPLLIMLVVEEEEDEDSSVLNCMGVNDNSSVIQVFVSPAMQSTDEAPCSRQIPSICDACDCGLSR